MDTPKERVQKLSFLPPFPPDLAGTRRTNFHPSDCDIGKGLLQLSRFQRPELIKHSFGGTKLIFLCIDPFSTARGHSFFGNLTKILP